MPKKWTPLYVEDSTNGDIVVYGNGDMRRDIDIYPTEEQYNMMLQGYMCVRCFELQETPFPETCGLPGCDGYRDGFPMRERQRQVLMSEMRDEVRTPSTVRSDIWLPGDE